MSDPQLEAVYARILARSKPLARFRKEAPAVVDKVKRPYKERPQMKPDCQEHASLYWPCKDCERQYHREWRRRKKRKELGL